MNQSIVDFFFPHFVVVACGKVRDNSSTSSSSSYFTSNQNEFPEFPERRNWGTWAASVRDDVTAPSIGIGNVATRIIIQINKQIAAEDETIIRNWRWCHQLEFISFLFSFSLSLSLSLLPLSSHSRSPSLSLSFSLSLSLNQCVLHCNSAKHNNILVYSFVIGVLVIFLYLYNANICIHHWDYVHWYICISLL